MTFKQSADYYIISPLRVKLMKTGVAGIMTMEPLRVLPHLSFRMRKARVLIINLVVENPDPETGLYAKNRFSKVVKLIIP
jgi:hypothetical protein